MKALQDTIYQIRYRRYLRTWVRQAVQPKASYAQFGEDLVIESLIDNVRSFIDIGANDGITGSNTFLFASRGARGLSFEPVKDNYNVARRVLSGMDNVRLVREGISSSSSESVIIVDGWQGQTSHITDSDSIFANGASGKQKVTLRPLSYWIDRFPEFSSVDLISIDVEGHELDVLKGTDFQRIHAKCIVIETDKISINDCDKFLSPYGYKAVVTNGINTFWIGPGQVAHLDINLLLHRHSNLESVLV